MQSAELDRDVAGAEAAHQRLLLSLDDLSDADAWQPSLLPGWTVGHVLTHIARNADGFVRMLKGADEGHIVDQYEGGRAGRQADIEAGAFRAAEALVSDVRMTIWKLEQAFDRAAECGWRGAGRMISSGDTPIAAFPRRRWNEVEIHHADLGLGYTLDDWPSEWVKSELKSMTGTWASRQPMGLTELPRAVLALSPNRRLGWLVGRVEIEGVAPAGVSG